MKKNDIPRLKEEVLKLLPITQTEMWKTLGIGHRDGAKIIGIMVKESLIKRTEIKGTFLLENANWNGKTGYSALLSGTTISPCCGCKEDCVAARCMQLTKWVIGN